jgi:hypothetical protein
MATQPSLFDPPPQGRPRAQETKLPPYVRSSKTSKQAAESVAPVCESLRDKIFRAIFAAGVKGKTCDECEEDLSMSHQTTSARIRELRQQRSILDTGLLRKTRSGRNAAVYVAANGNFSGRPK